jgi:hypothetical protein
VKKNLVIILAIILVFGFSCSAMAADSVFADVPAKHWAYDSLAKLAKAGIIEGYDNKTFNGERTLTRYEMATIVANAMTKEDKADAATKAEIDKLQTEFSNELTQLGARVSAVEKRVNDIGNVKFSFWGRVLTNTYKDPIATTSGTGNMDTQIRYKMRMSSQLDDNVWVNTVLGYDQGYNTNTNNTSNWNGGIQLQKMYTKIKTGNWYFNFGRQSSNESDVVGRLATGMTVAASTYFDGLSTYYVDPKNANNKFFVGEFNRAYGGAVRNVNIINFNYDLFPNFNLTGSHFKDGDKKGVASSGYADINTIGFDYKFGKDNKFRLLPEYGKNNRAKAAAGYEGSAYNGSNTGWDTLLQYGQSNIKKPGSWDISADLRRFQPGFEPYSGTEWVGGVYSPSTIGITGSNVDNVKGVGVYFGYVPYKNIYTQLSWYNFAPVVKNAGADGRYRQAVRLMVDFMY